MKLRFKNVRFRLTLWYSGTLFLILLFYTGLSVVMLFLNLRRTLDDQLEHDYEIVENLIKFDKNDSIRFDMDDDPFIRERWVEVWSPKGKLLFESRPFSGQSLPGLDPDVVINSLKFKSLRLENNARFRVVTGKANIEEKWLLFRMLRSEQFMMKELSEFFILLLITLPFALIISAIGGYLLAGKLLSPIDKMTNTAKNISSNNLQERLPVMNPDDEFGHLSITINELLTRVEQSFDRLKQFTFDAAHELRTPLTIIRSIGEVALQEPGEVGNYRETIGSILEENNRLTHLVNSLLLLARADSNVFKTELETTHIKELLQHTVDVIQPLAEEKGQIIRFEQKEAIISKVDPTLLRHALLNLLDNAIKYGPGNSTITVSVDIEEKKRLQIGVEDKGPTIPEKYRNKIFERFFRLDKSRARDSGGSGLGLAIVKWAIEIQGGSIHLESRSGLGNLFVIILPYIQ